MPTTAFIERVTARLYYIRPQSRNFSRLDSDALTFVITFYNNHEQQNTDNEALLDTQSCFLLKSVLGGRRHGRWDRDEDRKG